MGRTFGHLGTEVLGTDSISAAERNDTPMTEAVYDNRDSIQLMTEAVPENNASVQLMT